jgi:hypothetical protein
MAKIIELCGVPGVGKSFVYANLVKNGKSKTNWAPADHLYPRKKIEFSSPRNFVRSLVKQVNGNLDADMLKEAGIRFVSKYPEYMNESWEAIQRKHICGKDLPDVRFKEALRLKRSTEFIQYLMENQIARYAIVDIGGLVQRLDFTWVASRSIADDKNEAERLLDLMPLPQAVVYFFADRDTVVKRLSARKRKIAIHKNLSRQELESLCGKYEERWAFVCEMLTQRNVPVLKIDSHTEVEISTDRIDRFVDQLS